MHAHMYNILIHSQFKSQPIPALHQIFPALFLLLYNYLSFFILLISIVNFAQKLLTCSVTSQTSISVFSQRCRPTSANLAVCRQLPPPSPANCLLIDLCLLIP